MKKIQNPFPQNVFSLFILTACLLVSIPSNGPAQSIPTPLVPGITVEFVSKVPPNCSRLAVDPVSGNLYYLNLNGDIHRLTISEAVPADEIVHTTDDHHIGFLQGMVFYDSLLYLVGDVIPDTAHTHGMVMKGKLRQDGTRKWYTVMYTALYPSGNTFFDHGFSGITISDDGKMLYVNSGSRTDHGEVQDNGGLFHSIREVPLTSAVFKIGARKKKLYLPNDSAALVPYLFCDGTRNSFDLVFGPNGHLFGCENSGDRDDPDELNWLRKGKHYGFPWLLGGNYNPMQFPGYDPETDLLLSKKRYAYKQGFYYNDPEFPPFPAGLTVTGAIRNYGPDADFFRDSVTGKVKDASVAGHNLKSFTPHRSPLGLVFDLDSNLAQPYSGDAFMLGFQRQGDSTGFSPEGKAGTLLDPCEDLLHVELVKSGSKYIMNCTRIVEGFEHPVDADMTANFIYVIENSVSDSANLWKITMPQGAVYRKTQPVFQSLNVFPNPSAGHLTVEYFTGAGSQARFTLFDLQGKEWFTRTESVEASTRTSGELMLYGIPSGFYVLEVRVDTGVERMKFLLVNAVDTH